MRSSLAVLALFASVAALPVAESAASDEPRIVLPSASPAASAGEKAGSTAAPALQSPASSPAVAKAPAPSSSGEKTGEVSAAQRELQGLLFRQQRLFAGAAREDNPNFDEDNFKQQAQELLFDFEGYLRNYPDTAAGYAAYGVFLSKVDMRRQSIAMLLKANKLDPNLPLVKNQIGNYLAEEGKVIEAANYFTAAINLSPDEPLYHYQLGTLLHEGRADFVKSGQWTEAALERSMFAAFKRAAELAPARVEFTYRFCEAYYDLANPVWDEALAAWASLENRLATDLEKETCRLHRANILLRQERAADARELLATISSPTLAKQKEKLVAELPENRKP